jgi:hypothetical protein
MPQYFIVSAMVRDAVRGVAILKWSLRVRKMHTAGSADLSALEELDPGR